MQLRPYQQQIIDDTREALKKHNSVLVVSPTGSGKTAILVHMMRTAASRGKRSFFCVHQNELLSQTAKALWAQKLPHGMIAAGRTQSDLPAQVASMQTLARRLDRFDCPDLIIIDEAHRSAAGTYQKVLEAYPDALVIGLTATPQRTDGKGLDDTYGCIVNGPTIAELIQAGYLCDYEIFAPPSGVDLSGIKTKMGDYDKKQVQEAVDKPTITGDAVKTYLKLAKGKRAAVMCVSLDHARHVMESYRVSGVPAEMLDGNMSNAEREAIIERLSAGKTLVVTAVNLMIEGLDVPAIEVVQWLRPTQSLIVYMQGNGRGFRPAAGKEKLLILDHVRNWERHGLPDDEREWSLEGKKSRKRKQGEDDEPDVKIQMCKQCFAVFRTGVDACPKCGAPVEKLGARKIEEIDGELERIDLEAERKQLQGAARSLADLVAVGKQRGMKNPAAWAASVYCARQGKKPTKADFKAANDAARAVNYGGVM